MSATRRLVWISGGAVAVCLVAAAAIACSYQNGPGVYRICRVAGPVLVDGHITPGEWERAQAVRPTKPTPGAELTTVCLAYDDQWLYVSIDCRDGDPMPAGPQAVHEDGLWFLIRTNEQSADQGEYRFAAAPAGMTRATYHRGYPPPMLELYDYTKPLATADYRAAVVRTAGGWSVEVALAWTVVGRKPPLPITFLMERRHRNGERIEVSDWPYETPVRFAWGR